MKGVDFEFMKRFSRFTAIVVSLLMLLSISCTATFASEDMSVEKTVTEIVEFLR